MASGSDIVGGAAAGAQILPALFGRGKSNYNAQDISHSGMYDAQANTFGPSGALDYAQQRSRQANAIDQRTSPQSQFQQTNYAQADADRQRALEARANQSTVMNGLMARAAGQTPSIAGMQAQQDSQRAAAAQGSMAASARGPAAMALAQQGAANNTANAQSRISNQSQINAANERLQAEQAAFGAASGMRSQDYGAQGQAAGQAQYDAGARNQSNQFNTGMRLNSRQVNDARAMGYEGMGHQGFQQEQQGAVQMQGIAAQSHANAQAANSKTEAQNANNKGLIDTVGDFFSSDMRAKEPYITSDFNAKESFQGTPLPSLMGGSGMTTQGMGGMSPLSGPAAASFDTLTAGGGGMDPMASLQKHSDFATQFQSDPTGGMAGGMLSDARAKDDAFKMGMELGQAKAEQKVMMAQPGWKPLPAGPHEGEREVDGRDGTDSQRGKSGATTMAPITVKSSFPAEFMKRGGGVPSGPSKEDDRVFEIAKQGPDARASIEGDRQWGDGQRADYVRRQREAAAKAPQPVAFGSDFTTKEPLRGGRFDTQLGSDEEREFQAWKSRYAPRDTGEDYDLRGAYRAGLTPDPKSGHWPDTFKKPNHETFSDESQYSKDMPALAGRWSGEKYTPPSKLGLTRDADGNPSTGDRDAPQFRFVPGQGWVNDAAPQRFSLEEMRDGSSSPDFGDTAKQDADIAKMQQGDAENKAIFDRTRREMAPSREEIAKDDAARRKMAAEAPDRAAIAKADEDARENGELGPSATVGRKPSIWETIGAAGKGLNEAQFGHATSDERAKKVLSPDQIAMRDGSSDRRTNSFDKSFHRDTPADQARVKRGVQDKAGRDADAMMASMGKSLERGPSAKVSADGDPPDLREAARLRDEAMAPSNSPMARANRTMKGVPYKYKPEFTPPDQKPGETNFGFMAQNLEKEAPTATAVKEDPNGLKRVDALKLLRVLGASVADLQEQQDETRIALKGGKSGKKGKPR